MASRRFRSAHLRRNCIACCRLSRGSDEYRLTSLISLYRNTLDQLGTHSATEDTAMAACLLRDQIGQELDYVRSETLSVQTIRDLQQDDNRLTNVLKVLCSKHPCDQFVAYRRTRNPPFTAWWWYCLDEEQTVPLTGDTLYHFITQVSLLVALGFALIIALRLSQIPVSLIDISTYIQVVPLLVGAAFTNLGQQLGKNLIHLIHTIRNIPANHYARTGMLLAFVPLTFTVALFFSLPILARWDNNQGRQALEYRRDPSSALALLQRAVSIDPNNSTAYYNLGNTYNELNRPEDAIVAYQHALELERISHSSTTSSASLQQPSLTWFASINNLAQLLTLQGDSQNAAIAIAMLNQALAYDPQQATPNVRSLFPDLYRNRAFVHLRSGLYRNAKNDLEQALQDDADSPTTACVAGFFYEDTQNPFYNKASAFEDWNICLGATPADHVPAIWIATARERYRGTK